MSELGIVLETEKELPQQKFIQKTDKSLLTDNLGDIDVSVRTPRKKEEKKKKEMTSPPAPDPTP